MNSRMNAGTFWHFTLAFFFTLSVGLNANAEVLEPGHSFYPADQELLALMGSDRSLSPSGAKNLIDRCDQGTSDSSDQSLCEVATTIRSAQVPLAQFPWTKLTAQVVFFGERHWDREIKDFLASNMQELHSQGFNTLALEMFNSSQQPLLDRFFGYQLSSEDLQAALKSVWGYEGTGYMNVVTEARAQGLRIIGLDGRDSKLSSDFFESIHQRDQHMSEILAKRMAQDPLARIIVYSGSLHGYKSFSTTDRTLSLPALLRKNYLLTTQSITSFGAKDSAGFNSIQKAVVGIGHHIPSVVQMPPTYPYTDFLLFLR